MNLFMDIVRRNEGLLISNIRELNHNDNSGVPFVDPDEDYGSPTIHRSWVKYQEYECILKTHWLNLYLIQMVIVEIVAQLSLQIIQHKRINYMVSSL